MFARKYCPRISCQRQVPFVPSTKAPAHRVCIIEVPLRLLVPPKQEVGDAALKVRACEIRVEPDGLIEVLNCELVRPDGGLNQTDVEENFAFVRDGLLKAGRGPSALSPSSSDPSLGQVSLAPRKAEC